MLYLKWVNLPNPGIEPRSPTLQAGSLNVAEALPTPSDISQTRDKSWPWVKTLSVQMQEAKRLQNLSRQEIWYEWNMDRTAKNKILYVVKE